MKRSFNHAGSFEIDFFSSFLGGVSPFLLQSLTFTPWRAKLSRNFIEKFDRNIAGGIKQRQDMKNG